MASPQRHDDFLNECNHLREPASDFKNMVCSRCRNPTCVNAGWAGSIWEQRMSTQVDRLLVRPTYADPKDSKFESVRSQRFMEVAPALILARKQDPWAGPNVHFADPDGQTDTSGTVDAAVAALTGKPVKGVEAPAPPQVQEPVPATVATQPSPVRPRVPTPQDAHPMNTDFPDEGLMVDGTPPGPSSGPQPHPHPSVPVDPWAPPSTPKGKVVAVGAKIKLGG